MNARTISPAPAPESAWLALQKLEIGDLHVEVAGDRVYLRGLASCYQAKRQAAKIAQAALPSVTVVNELRIAHAADRDDAVRRSVVAAIRRADPDAARAVRVEVHAGIVHLDGVVDSEERRRAVEAAAWQARGVAHVHSRIQLQSPPGDDEVARCLSEYVARAVGLPPGAIAVTYSKGVAALTGAVASEEQRQAIEDLVRWHDRVTDVDNRLRVAAPHAR
ncbi:MAG TPA: BON domain-containing protein [Dehalococcoidia bacterium]|nr:BON domain-containing protein [Dehalococcoidia bacterium]